MLLNQAPLYIITRQNDCQHLFHQLFRAHAPWRIMRKYFLYNPYESPHFVDIAIEHYISIEIFLHCLLFCQVTPLNKKKKNRVL